LDLIPFEAIVVGSGSTGGMAALTLAQQGIKVLVIEAGPYLDRQEACNKEPFDTLKRINGLISKKHNKQIQHPGYWKNNPNLYANEIKYPYIYPKDKPFLWTQGKQYGGRSLTWGGITLRLAPSDFNPSLKDGFGPNWPISYNELSSHYHFAEKITGIYGRNDNINQVPNGSYIGEIPLTSSEEFFGNKVKTLLNYPFIQSRGFDRNCAVNEKDWPNSSSIGSTIKMANKTGNIQILTDYLVESFETNKETELATTINIVNTTNGIKQKLNCKLIFLCASTISTLRILLNSEKRFNSSGFHDTSGKLGKYLMDHVSICRFFSIPNKANLINSLDENATLSGAGSFFIPFGSEVPNDSKIDFLRGYGIWGGINRLGIPNFMKKVSGESVGFLISHGEVLPRSSNKVLLSKEIDQWEIPIPQIEFEWSQNELKMVEHMKRTMKNAINAADGEIKEIGDIINIPFLNFLNKKSIALSGNIPSPGYYIHEVGGAPMGDKEEESVLDNWNRLWRCKNVFVLDGACWPTSSWQSPTLTMMAISRRACLGIKQLI
tara:strand:- start:4424 stop:6067 length:1644 start_codon:yes stop_codon:yes gene_type:complete